MKVFTYLKRQKHRVGRYVNIILISMQVLSPIAVLLSLGIIISQEGGMDQIIKTYVTLGFITKIDNMLAQSLSKEIV